MLCYWQFKSFFFCLQVCSNEGKCICHLDWTGKDCSVFDPLPVPKVTGLVDKYKGTDLALFSHDKLIDLLIFSPLYALSFGFFSLDKK